MVSKEFGAADGDRDGTLYKDEYLAIVEKSFKAADRDNDGTLDAKEPGSARGRVTAIAQVASLPWWRLRGLLATEGCKIGI
jgi:EF hand